MSEKNLAAVRMKQATEAQKKMKADAALSTVNMAFSALVENKEENPKLPEPVFKEHFLPFLTGQKPISEQPTVLKDWVDVAKSPMGEVDVVNEKGDTLFTVPPIYDSGVIDVVKRNLGESFSEIYSQYAMHTNNLPILGERFLANTFEKKVPQMTKASENAEQIAAGWKKVFDHYSLTAQTGNTVVNLSNHPADDLEYD